MWLQGNGFVNNLTASTIPFNLQYNDNCIYTTDQLIDLTMSNSESTQYNFTSSNLTILLEVGWDRGNTVLCSSPQGSG